MRRLVCACVVRKPPKTGFLALRPISLPNDCNTRKDAKNYSETCEIQPLSKDQNCFSRQIIASCRSKVLQNDPRGAFCMRSTFIKLPFVIKIFDFSFLSGRFTQVLLQIIITGTLSNQINSL